MASSNLILHRGAREVSREELALVPMPAQTKTWAPVGHQRVLDTALATIQEAGFQLERMRLGLSADGGRFFGTLDLATQLSPDGIVTLAVGVRNSIDKTYPQMIVMWSSMYPSYFLCKSLVFNNA